MYSIHCRIVVTFSLSTVTQNSDLGLSGGLIVVRIEVSVWSKDFILH